MAKRVEFTSNGVVNGKTYKKGDELSVSESIYVDLTDVQQCAKEKITKKTKKD